MTTIAERVQRGAELLDRERPGWDHRIDLETLDLGDQCRCVLGQEYGWYANGARKLLIHHIADSFKYGFEIDQETYRGLTRAWKRLIRARRAAQREVD